MNLRNFIRLGALAVVSAVGFGCTPENKSGEEKKNLNENLAFTLEVTEVESDKAKIKVEHNGERDDTWYGFATTESNIDEAVLDKIDELLEGKETIIGLQKSTQKTVTIRDLEPKTDYTYIVFGLTEDGTIYGIPETVEFTTQDEVKEVTFEPNPAWTVEYTGKGTINETEYEHTVTVTSTDANTYFITGISKSWIDAYSIKEIAESELEYLMAFIDYYNEAYSTNITIANMLFKGNGMDALDLIPGDWYAMAIGVDSNGNLTGHYAISEVINIPEEPATEAYLSWIGDFTWTGANGVSFNVTFKKGINNLYYYMSGWEGAATEGLDIQVEWMPDYERWIIYTQYFGTFEFEGGIYGDIYVLGADSEYIYPISGFPICQGGVNEDGSLTAIGYEETDEEGNSISIKHMQFSVATEEGFYQLSNTQEWPEFPVTITKKTSAEVQTLSAEGQERKSVQKFTNAPKPLRYYYPIERKARK